MIFNKMIQKANIFDINISQQKNYLKIPFPNLDYQKENHPYCGMSLKIAGSMRFRNAETNQNRLDFFASLGIDINRLVQPELSHSKEVYNCFRDDSHNPVFESFLTNSFQQKPVVGDGIITKEKSLVLVITVADCVPIWFYEPDSQVFGIVHSGWKGTGIIENALQFAEKKYKAKIPNFRVIIGPHIHSCCYKVDKEREQFFNSNFAPDSCVNQMLSLEKANLFLLEKIGIKPENLISIENCTSCETDFGSFRRETGANIEKPFTVMSCFTFYTDFTKY